MIVGNTKIDGQDEDGRDSVVDRRLKGWAISCCLLCCAVLLLLRVESIQSESSFDIFKYIYN